MGTVPCVHYEAPGSQGIPDSIAPYCRDYNALLLANHGAVAWGGSLMEAWYRLESTEHYAMVIMYTGNIIGKANVLSCEQVGELIEIRKKMGITNLPTMCINGQIKHVSMIPDSEALRAEIEALL